MAILQPPSVMSRQSAWCGGATSATSARDDDLAHGAWMWKQLLQPERKKEVIRVKRGEKWQ